MTTINLNQVANGGIAMGTALIATPPNLAPVLGSISSQDIELNIQVVTDAINTAIAQLHTIIQKDPTAADILDTHIELLKSNSLLASLKEKIKAQKNPQLALKETEDELATRFEAIDDPYLQERASDIRDICKRVMAILKGVSLNIYDNIVTSTIIFAKELHPSDTSAMDFGHIKGFVTEQGGTTSHTCIIARNVGIACAVGQGGALDKVTNGDFVILDGNCNLLLINPTANVIEQYKAKQQKLTTDHATYIKDKDLPATTTDDHGVLVYANAGSIQDIQRALANGADGIGLFRTEFLYMNEKSTFPTEDAQYHIYKQAVSLTQDKPLVIRTLDIGGDKTLPYFKFPQEDNPFLGWRGIRLTLELTDIFKAQLRALLRASAQANLQIMYPFIISVEEYRQANAILNQCKDELRTQGIPFNQNIQTGIMIETPASVLLANDLAKEADFFSIGTNDLTQYILATDRGNTKVAHTYNQQHPAVLQAIAMAIKAANNQGIPVGMCGNLSADPNATQLLLNIGLKEYSVPPTEVAHLKHTIRQLPYSK